MAADEAKDDIEMKAGEEQPEVAEEQAQGEEAAKAKEAEKPKELEEDALPETRPKVAAGSVEFNTADSTLNVLSSNNGKILNCLTGGGFQYLMAGSRASVGMKSGRYLVEIKILELHSRMEPQGAQGRAPHPRHIVKVGLSHAGSSLILGDGSASVFLDSEGFFNFDKTRKKVGQNWRQGSVIGFLINMDAAGPNPNSISLFRDGVRICEPQSIPDALLGKPLFPTITYKAATLQVNYGPVPLAPLAFKCNMLDQAAQADVEVVPRTSTGERELVVPVGLPEQGYFDWVDSFVEQNPGYVELSDRKIVEWACKSGLTKPRGGGPSFSLDKPDMKFGIPLMDDLSVRKLLLHIAPTTGKNLVVPELKANLIADERMALLKQFPGFKKVAKVLVGEPTAAFKAKAQQLIVEEKTEKIAAERKKKAAEAARLKAIEDRKKKLAMIKKKDGEEEPATEEKAEEPVAEEEIVVELTDEEKALWYRKGAVSDMTESVLAKSFMKFSVPTAEEGFDQVAFEWQAQDLANKVVKDWIFAKKMTQRVDNVQPGQWFKDSGAEWNKTLAAWKKLQAEWKDVNKRKALLAKRAEAKKKEAEEKGEEPPKDDEAMEINAEDVEPSAVDDVADIGSGEPLFANFAYEDWALVVARYEFHLLIHSFKQDVDDPDRQNFAEKDLSFYYTRYFKKQFSLRNFNVDSFEKFVDLVKDSVRIAPKTGFVEALHSQDAAPSTFVKLAEDHRRERQRRSDAGDESAELKFPRTAASTGPVNPAQPRLTPQQPARAPTPAAGGLRPANGSGAVVGAGVKRPAPPTSAPVSYVAKRPTFGGGWRR